MRPQTGWSAPVRGPRSKRYYYSVLPNLTRITVQGSTSAPSEWLRLTIDLRAPEVFSWENIVYCANALVGCP